MSSMRSVFCCVCLLLGVPALEAHATIVIYQTLQQQIISSSRIVRGKVTSKRSLWGPNRRLLYTDYQLQVLETLKGNPSKSITFRQLGGQLGNNISFIPGSAHYKIGEEVVLFFEPERKPGFLFVQGLAAGKFSVLRQNNEIFLQRDTKRLAFYAPPSSESKHKVQHLNYTERPLSLGTLRQKIMLLRPQMRLRAIPGQEHKRQLRRQTLQILKAHKRALEQGRLQALSPSTQRPSGFKLIAPRRSLLKKATIKKTALPQIKFRLIQPKKIAPIRSGLQGGPSK